MNPLKPTRTGDGHARDGLLTVLMGLTVLSGLIDAVSYLGLGRLFLGKMTGNVVVLGFATAHVPGFAVASAAGALVSFLLGAVAAGRLHTTLGKRVRRWVSIALIIEAVLLIAAAVVAMVRVDHAVGPGMFALIVLLAGAMGFRNATARKLAVPDMTTTLITLTLADLAADSSLAGGRNPRMLRRAGAVIAMFGGASLGGFLVTQYGLRVPLLLAAGLATSLAVGYLAYHSWRQLAQGQRATAAGKPKATDHQTAARQRTDSHRDPATTLMSGHTDHEP